MPSLQGPLGADSLNKIRQLVVDGDDALAIHTTPFTEPVSLQTIDGASENGNGKFHTAPVSPPLEQFTVILP